VGALAALGLAGAVAARGALQAPPPAPVEQAAAPVVDAVGCQPASITGSDTSPELARALGLAACVRLGADLGVEWGLPKASSVLEVAGDLRPDGARVTLSIAGRSAEAEAATPIDAVIAAVPKLAERLRTPPPSAAQIQDWGARDEDSARRIRRAWRRHRYGFSQDPLAEANRLLESDPESAWSHAIVAQVDPSRAEPQRDRALELADKLSPARAKALRGWLRYIDPRATAATDREAVALLRQAESERPEDGDITVLYADTVTDEERLALAGRAEARWSPGTSVELCSMVVSDHRIPLEERGKAFDRLEASLPEAVVWSNCILVLLLMGRIDETRAAVALGERLGLADANESRAMLARATLEPAALREAGIRMLRDPAPSTRDIGSSAVVLSHLMEGHILEAERSFLQRSERLRGNGQALEAATALLDELRLRRWLDRPPGEAERVRWLEDLARASPPGLRDRDLFYAGIELAFARAGARLDRAAAEKALAVAEADIEKKSEGVAATRDGARVGAMPLLRAARGDAECAKQWREIQRSITRFEPVGIFDLGLALEGAGDRAEAERVHRMAMSTTNALWHNAANGFVVIAARVRLAEILRATGRAAEAHELDAVVDRVWATADAGLRDSVRKLK
jgi:hypothetical protein